jgi:hypothetical protein
MRAPLRSLLVPLVAALGTVFALPAAGAAAVSLATDSPAVGYDVSFPECGQRLPAEHAFGVVGVDGGVPTRANPCLASELRWAWSASGSARQPAAQLYLNTANPGAALAGDGWPASGTTPYGPCEGGDTAACSWQYGWERARDGVTSFFTPAALDARVDSRPSNYTWWLDVETANTWRYGSAAALDRNRAVLEGMTAYLEQLGARVGVYGLAGEWPRIVGTVAAGSPLHRLDSWLAGARSLADAAAACARAPLLAGGTVAVVQFVSGGLDQDVSCS